MYFCQGKVRFMKKLVFVVFLLPMFLLCVSTTGCTDKKSASTDSVATDTTAEDTSRTDSAENLIAETPMPKAADELFDDFIFNFAANKKLQYSRIVFPLKVYHYGKLSQQIAKSHWPMEHFFMRQDYYTLIFDNRRQMEVVKDTTIDHVVVEKIFFKQKTVKQYLFNRINGQWMLTSVNYKPMYANKNASFLKFYNSFATDTAFQVRHLSNPVKFTGPDPDDDFSTMTGDLLPEQWLAFAPPMPHGMIYNIIYGQKYTESNEKFFVIRGIANGLEQEFSFHRKGGKWMLTKLNI